MGDSLKDKIQDKIIDELINFISGKSKEELINIITKDDLKKIFFKTMKDFSMSTYFQNELRNYIFNDDNGIDLMNMLDNEMIKPGLAVEQLTNNTQEVINLYFISDYDDARGVITQTIISKYRQNASLKLKLYDLLIQQENFYNNTKHQLDNQSKILNEIKNKQVKEEDDKKFVMKHQIRSALITSLSKISNNYLHFVLKKSASFVGAEETSDGLNFKKAIIETISNIDNLVGGDFLKNPIYVVIFNQESIDATFNGGKPLGRSISYKDFCTYYFKKEAISEIRKILQQYEHNLTKEFINDLLELESNYNSMIFMTGLEVNINLDLENATFDLLAMQKEIHNLGDILIRLYDQLKKEL
ncbi:hypothetical protein LL037_21490 [Clostridium estertheticum]|uniref:hypothetical protein n=1 Tax=Clostridium estertheticum TaxID=238834 RepID=UPI001C0E5D71|nr:hypothetical protein [Clostridium estertheticum]MBU3198317.1 hypothetical protein [Clostridium estertheticum]WAG65004.1 hypothetical protein LL037_21490 [Clostridium estertheticum]